MNNSTSSLSCLQRGFYDDLTIYTVLLTINGILFATSCVCIAFMIAIMILFKKYYFFTQRLILYVALSSFVYSFFNIINVFARHAFLSETVRDLCSAFGFISQITYWWVFMSVTFIVVDIVIKVIFSRGTEKLELMYILATVLFPLTFSWIPFIFSAYGPAGTSCWIRDRKYEDCTYFKKGAILRFSLYYVPLYLMLILLTIFLGITLWVNHQRQKQWTLQSNQQIITAQKIVAKEVRSLFAYPVIFIVTNVIPFAYRIYDLFVSANNDEESQDYVYTILALLTIVVFGVQGVIITIVFTLDPETRKKLTVVEIRAAVRRWCGKDRNSISAYPIGKNTSSDSFVDDDTSSTQYTKLTDN